MENLSTAGGTPERTGQLPLDRRLELLSARRRRYVVRYLQGVTDPVALADLSRQVAEWEAEPNSTAAHDEQKAVHASMHHCHVPKLAEADVVAYDQDRNAVETASNFECVADLLNALSDADG